MYKAPQTPNAKNLLLNCPQGACTWKIALKYKVKQSKNSKFTSNYKASQSISKRKFPNVDKPFRI